MKVTILNGNPRVENIEFDRYVAELSDLQQSNGHSVAVLPLRELDVKYCTGCFDCWVKSPGECKVTDRHALGLSTAGVDTAGQPWLEQATEEEQRVRAAIRQAPYARKGGR